MKKVIGVIGPLGAGKDSAVNFIQKETGWPAFQMSDELRKLAEDPKNMDRKSFRLLGIKTSKELGDDFLAKSAFGNVNEGSAIFGGIRQMGQIKFLQNNSDFTLIAIDADPELRFKRASNRGTSKDLKSREEFEFIEREEDFSDVLCVRKCMEHANHIIHNNGTKEELFEKLREILVNEEVL